MAGNECNRCGILAMRNRDSCIRCGSGGRSYTWHNLKWDTCGNELFDSGDAAGGFSSFVIVLVEMEKFALPRD